MPETFIVGRDGTILPPRWGEDGWASRDVAAARAAAGEGLEHGAPAWEIVTGLLYLDPEPKDMHSYLRTTEKPLNELDESILIPGQGWQLVSEGHQFTEGPAADGAGNLVFTDIPANRINKLNDISFLRSSK